MIRITIFLILVSLNGIAQTKKPTQKQPSKASVPVVSRPYIDQKEVEKNRLLKEKKTADSLNKIAQEKIESEARIKKEFEAKKAAENERKKYEEITRLERESNERRIAEELRLKELNNRNKFGLGLKFGPSVSTIRTDEIGSINKSYLRSLTAGIFVNLPITKNFSIIPEFILTRKGFLYKYESDYDKLTMDYFELPLSVRSNLLIANRFTIYGKIGGYGSYWLRGNNKSEISGEKSQSKYIFDTDFTDGYKDNRVDYGATSGLGLESKGFKSNLFLEANYSYGLSSVSKLENELENIKLPAHRYLNFCIGIRF